VEGPWVTNILLTFNTERKPFDDVRVRRALTLAIDRWGGSQALGKVTLIKGVSGTFRPGAEWSLPKEELEKMPGFWPDIEKSRAEAKRLLAEAGHPNLKVKLVNRTIDQPFIPAGIYAVDQWRRIGVTAEHAPLETKLWFAAMEAGDFDVVVQNISDFADDPTAQFNTLLSKHVSGIAYSRHGDTKLDELFTRQSQIVDKAERMKVVNAFERHALETAYNIPLLWYQRIVVNHKKVRGWDLTPSHFTGQNLVEVWLDE
jgi:peptide/nickel transport system substrate-binding protein